jgi:hypothetical protein
MSSDSTEKVAGSKWLVRIFTLLLAAGSGIDALHSNISYRITRIATFASL